METTTMSNATRTTKDAAAEIRHIVREDVRRGRLPADWRISVRAGVATHEPTLDIRATSPRPLFVLDPATIDPWSWDNPIHPQTGRRCATWRDARTVEAADVYERLESLRARLAGGVLGAVTIETERGVSEVVA